ncbi:MAG: response regulator [Candidatus Sumerlaea chitinivorans]|uniref:Response regulator n=1 Tax=Sumerlaea chitinivorans TaxID=2250252 RepID=A0A2Z4Y629_SUMC1|nr:Response regulator [Candidatus Sumerlaea chitinivorans]MCX7964072.1 response regulator [Candidatus Sumerlaea chitinivorans]
MEKKRILIVDDEKNIRTLFRDELEEAGYEVATADSGADALAKLDIFQPDLVVLDIRMPDMTGIEVLEQLRKKYEDLPVIMCTAVRGLKDDFTIWEARVSDYVTKPVDLDDLKAKIRKALGEG